MPKGIKSESETDQKKGKKEKQSQVNLLKNKLIKKEEEVKTLKMEIKNLKDSYFRQVAERENQRKRLEREKSEFYHYALADLFKEMLLILDNFERALSSEDECKDKSLRNGIELIYKQYQDILKKRGVNLIEIKEKKFDPNYHQAFITEESDNVQKPEVKEVFQQGYTLHDRLLRPALVKVVVPKKEK